MQATHRDIRSGKFETFLVESINAQQVAHFLCAELSGENIPILSVATYWAQARHSICYNVTAGDEGDTKQRVVLCSPANASTINSVAKIIVEDPRKSFLMLLAKVTPDFDRTVREQFDQLGLKQGVADIHKSAIVEDGTIIGEGCIVEPNVVIKRGTLVGQNSCVSANSVLGTQGPAIYTANDRTISYRHLHYGTLQVLNNVEIGSNCVLLKGMLGRTLVGSHTIIGNLAHVGHGCEIKDHVWIAANVTICGHTVLGANTSIGAGAVVRDNVVVGRNVSIGMGSVVVKNVKPETTVIGVPAKERNTSRSNPDR